MGSFELLRFLHKSKDTVSIDLVALNLIVLKKPYSSRKIILLPNRDEDGKIKGTVWMESKHKNNPI